MLNKWYIGLIILLYIFFAVGSVYSDDARINFFVYLSPGYLGLLLGAGLGWLVYELRSVQRRAYFKSLLTNFSEAPKRAKRIGLGWLVAVTINIWLTSWSLPYAGYRTQQLKMLCLCFLSGLVIDLLKER